jgi:hypothetical protein
MVPVPSVPGFCIQAVIRRLSGPMMTPCEFATTYFTWAPLAVTPAIEIAKWAQWGLWGAAAGSNVLGTFVCD